MVCSTEKSNKNEIGRVSGQMTMPDFPRRICFEAKKYRDLNILKLNLQILPTADCGHYLI